MLPSIRQLLNWTGSPVVADTMGWVEAQDVFSTGAVAGDTFEAGMVAGDTFSTGAIEGDAHG